MERAGFRLEGTREILRGLIVLGGNPEPTGETGIQVPCCPGFVAETFTIRMPDGLTGTLTHQTGSATWSGTVSVTATAPRYPFPFAWPVAFTLTCGTFGGAPAWILASTARYSQSSPGPGMPLVLHPIIPGTSGGFTLPAYSFRPRPANTGNCTPFNLAFPLFSGGGGLYTPYFDGDNFLVYAV
jgi:hypothetical protein